MKLKKRKKNVSMIRDILANVSRTVDKGGGGEFMMAF